MSTTTEVTLEDLHQLLDIFEKKSFEAGSCEEGTLEEEISKRCEHLFKKDYTLIELDNTNGVLSPRYPGRIFIPEYEHGHMATTITANNSSLFHQSNTTTTPQKGCHLNSTASGSHCSTSKNMGLTNNSDLQHNVSFANPSMQQAQQQPQQQLPQQQPPEQQPPEQQPQQQSSQYPNPPPQSHLYYPHQTAPVPSTNSMTNTTTNTIYEALYDVSKVREIITMAKYARCRQRFAVPVIMYRGKYICRSATISINAEAYGRKVVDYAYDCLNGTNYSDRASNSVDDENNDNNEDSLVNQALNEPSPFSYEEVIKSDIQLLNNLNVNIIVDLMVEKRKIKYFMAVSSSEKADPENHYEKFNLLSLPYPGCEFFKKFRDNNYMAKNLYYNWDQSFNDAEINVPKLGPATDLNVLWDEYKTWDLVLLTQNYIKVCLKYIQEETSGLLIHCISGWDRTPLFISLVRLSMWADGLIHQSMNAMQITYFTVAYDWFLFGHQLPDRLKRGEDIMFFCFHVLKFITDEEFSIVEHRKRTKTSSSSGSSVIVIKSDSCDDEPPKEDLNLSINCDHDSNDSFSNSSNCDMSITDNFYATATTSQASSNNIVGVNPLTNRSPNPKRSKTSPISVPGASATRQRLESTSSNGSWQVVTDTGSIDSLMNGSCMMKFLSQQQDGNSVTSSNSGTGNSSNSGSGGSGSAHNSSNTPSIGSNASGGSSTNGALNNITNSINARDNLPSTRPTAILRKQRLIAVRTIFIQAYGKTVGFKFKEGSSINLATFVGTLADQLF